MRDRYAVIVKRPQITDKASPQKQISVFASVILLLLAATNSLAAPKALIIGLSEYAHPSSFAPSISDLNLPGVVNDINKMSLLAKQLGFAPENIITLSNASATEHNIKQTIRQELTRGVRADDRVLIYFSGHGSVVWDESGDEEDNQDEVLLTYDAHFIEQNGGFQLSGRLLDDEMEELLDSIPSNRVLFIVDACHSGNINKSLLLYGDRSLRIKSAANPHLTKSLHGSEKNTPEQQDDSGEGITVATSATHQSAKSKASQLWQSLTARLGLDLSLRQNKGRIFFTATNESGKTMVNASGSLFTSSLINALVNTPDTADGTAKIDMLRLKLGVKAELERQHSQLHGEPQLFGDEELIKHGY